MSLFVCDKCNHVDEMDVAYPQQPLAKGIPIARYLCTKCQKKEWHGLFTYRPYSPNYDVVINRPTGIGLG